MRIEAKNFDEFAQNCVKFKNARVRAEGDHIVFITGASKIADAYSSWKGRRVLGLSSANYRDFKHNEVFTVLHNWKHDLPSGSPWKLFGTGDLITAKCFSGEMTSVKSKTILTRTVEQVKGPVSQEQVVKALQKLLRKEQQFKLSAEANREHQENERDISHVFSTTARASQFEMSEIDLGQVPAASATSEASVTPAKSKYTPPDIGTVRREALEQIESIHKYSPVEMSIKGIFKMLKDRYALHTQPLSDMYETGQLGNKTLPNVKQRLGNHYLKNTAAYLEAMRIVLAQLEAQYDQGTISEVDREQYLEYKDFFNNPSPVTQYIVGIVEGKNVHRSDLGLSDFTPIAYL